MNSTLNFIDGHQISYAVAGACALLGCIYWFFRSEKISYS